MNELIDAVAVTAELTGKKLTEAAARVMIQDLAGYPLPAVLAALKRCRHELRGPLTVAEVVSRLDDGRPGPEEAWALMPKDEHSTAVLTQEMSEAYFSGAHELDPVAGRMAFMEVYRRLVTSARANRIAPHWFVSRGSDRNDAPIIRAAQLGRLSISHAWKQCRDREQALAQLATPETLHALPDDASTEQIADALASQSTALVAA